jgi:hypothetical protein
MKKRYTILAFLLITASTFAQAPEKMSYQAVVRDATNTLVTNQSVGMQISILQTTITGASVYTETHSVTTNINGLVSLEIGTGSTSDDFSAIDWGVGPYFIKTETDPAGGTSYSITGTSQLMSVPFAMYAKTSGSSEANATNIDNNTTDITTNTTAISANTAKVGYTEALVSGNTDVAANTAKVGITIAQASEITTNNAKTGITADQASDITANTAKVGYTEALVSGNTAVAANTSKDGITEAQASAITDNTDKVGITEDQATAITDNTSKVGITAAQASEITTNNAKISFDSTSSLRLASTDGTNTGDQDISGIATNATAITDNTSKVGITTYSIGDFAHGGIVFWIDETGQHGLVCAKEDQSAAVRWYAGTDGNTQAKGDGIYSGKANTAIIIAAQVAIGDDGNTYAARICNELQITEGGITYGDWYLPSKYELNLMYSEKAKINTTATANVGSNFATSYYWSSTEDENSPNSLAWVQYFLAGSQYNFSKSNTKIVRAVRAF